MEGQTSTPDPFQRAPVLVKGYEKKVWDKVKTSRDPAGTNLPCLLCTSWHWLLIRLCINKLLKGSKTICFCVTTQQKQCCINVSLGLACARYPVHSGSRPPSLSAASGALPCLSTIFLFLGCPCLYVSSEVTVTSISHPSFVSHRGLFHTNQRSLSVIHRLRALCYLSRTADDSRLMLPPHSLARSLPPHSLLRSLPPHSLVRLVLNRNQASLLSAWQCRHH